jgi:hypothetical protein
MNNLDRVKHYLAEEPDTSAEYIVKTLGVTKPYAYALLSKGRKELGMRKNPDGKWRHKIRMQTAIENPVIENPVIETIDKQPDPVNNPAHYTTGGIETIDFIEAKRLGYNLGNVVKYITRADHKGNKLEDLRKAQWYLSREIVTLK